MIECKVLLIQFLITFKRLERKPCIKKHGYLSVFNVYALNVRLKKKTRLDIGLDVEDRVRETDSLTCLLSVGLYH